MFCGESDAIVLCFSAGAYDVQLLVVVYFFNVLERKIVVDCILLQRHAINK